MTLTAARMQVDATLQKLELDLTEAEFAMLLAACAHDKDHVRGQRVLQRMGRELTALSGTTLAVAASYFRSAPFLPSGLHARLPRACAPCGRLPVITLWARAGFRFCA